MTTQAKILVVDDDPVVAKSIDRVLSGKGYAVITASDGPEALQKLAQEKYDAVFADIRMPGMDGIEMTARIKASQPWLPVVIVTGFGSADNEARAREIGVAGFLHKPLSPEMIEGSAHQVLQRAAEEAISSEVATAAATAIEAAPQRASAGRTLKDLGLFFAAPFIGLAYAIALPFAGLWLLARYGYQALRKKSK